MLLRSVWPHTDTCAATDMRIKVSRVWAHLRSTSTLRGRAVHCTAVVRALTDCHRPLNGNSFRSVRLQVYSDQLKNITGFTQDEIQTVASTGNIGLCVAALTPPACQGAAPWLRTSRRSFLRLRIAL